MNFGPCLCDIGHGGGECGQPTTHSLALDCPSCLATRCSECVRMHGAHYSHCSQHTARESAPSMCAPTFQQMTPEQLGDTATDRELLFFQIACSMLQQQEGLSDEDVTERVWNNGDWMPMVYRIIGPPWVQDET